MDDNLAVYQALVEAQTGGKQVVLVTIIETQGSIPRHAGSKMLVYADGSIVGTVGGGAMESRAIEAAKAALASGESRIESYSLSSLENGDPGICGGTAKMFFEPLGVAPLLLIIGVGHTGKALAELGKWAGFRVAISDDRPEFCNAEYLPGMDAYVVCKPGDIADHITIDKQAYIAALTRGLPIDIDLIPRLLQTPAPYIGVIGSRRRWALTVNALQDERGLSPDELARIHAPIGLEIEAETPVEIAISILAEIIMIRRGGTGKPMQWIGEVNAENG